MNGILKISEKINIKKIAFNIFLVYLAILPLIDRLTCKVYGKIGIDNIFFMIIFFAGLFGIGRLKIRIRDVNGLFILFVSVFITASFFPTVSAFIFGDSPNPGRITEGLRFMQVVFIAVFMYWFMAEIEDLKNITTAYLVGVIIAAAVGIGQALDIDILWKIAEKYYIYGTPHLTNFISHRKVPAFFGETGNTFGAYMSMAMIYILGMAPLMKGKKVKIYILELVIFVGLIVSLSITSILSCAAGCMSLLIIQKRDKNSAAILKQGMILIAGVLILSTFYSEKIADRVKKKLTVSRNNMVVKEEEGASGRADVENGTGFSIKDVKGMSVRYSTWRLILETVRKRSVPKILFGVGYGDDRQGDNYFIELLSVGGVISVAALLVLLGAMMLSAFRKSLFFRSRSNRMHALYLTVFSELLALLIMCLTGSYLSYLEATLPIAISVVAAAKLEKEEAV
ncbi:MAG: hypothetical protein JXJ19_03000 [Elusimicrobia bacterium]|nr:hypothetical protein [Elusimicrobiota bacterium]